MLFTHEYRCRIKAEQVDLYGHVNNAQYLQLLEAARWNWLESYGGSRELVKELGVGPIVLEIQVKFVKELKVDEEILIKSWRELPIRRIYTQEQEIYNSKNELACKALLRMGFMDLQTRKLVDVPESWKAVLEANGETRENA